MTYPCTIHSIPRMEILSIRDQVDAASFPAFLGQAFPALYEHVRRDALTAEGHPFVIYHAFGPERIDAEVCVPVTGPATVPDADPSLGGGQLGARVLAAATIVRTLHVGPYENLGEAYAALTAWVVDHGHASAGPVRERYLTGPSDSLPPSAYRTEIDLPVTLAEGGSAGLAPADESAAESVPLEVG